MIRSDLPLILAESWASAQLPELQTLKSKNRTPWAPTPEPSNHPRTLTQRSQYPLIREYTLNHFIQA